MHQWLQRLFSAFSEPRFFQAQPGAVPLVMPARPAPPAPDATIAYRDDVSAAYYGWLFDRQDDSNLELTPQEIDVINALEAVVHSKQSGAALVGRLPGVIPQLLQSLRSDNFSGTQIARKISSDVVLVAAVIRLANSAMQNRNNTITSVEHAVIVIGQEGLRQLVATVAFRPIVDLKSGHFTRTLMPRIQNQSERCAIANRVLAEQLGIDPFQAFLCGLVQNVGLVVSLRMMDKIAKDKRQLGSAVFCASLAYNARLLACSIGREWHFPDAVIVAIEEQLGSHVSYSPLGRLLSMTDYFSKVRILVQQSRLADDPDLFQGLPDPVQRCYLTLSALEENTRHERP